MLSGCDTDRPDNLIEEETYLNIFTELAVLNQMRDEQIAPVSREYLAEEVFERYNITREQFNNSHHYYQMDADAHLERITQLERKLNDERALIQAVIDSVEREAEEFRRLQELHSQEADSL